LSFIVDNSLGKYSEGGTTHNTSQTTLFLYYDDDDDDVIILDDAPILHFKVIHNFTHKGKASYTNYLSTSYWYPNI
jgi:hypothetical protein